MRYFGCCQRSRNMPRGAIEAEVRRRPKNLLSHERKVRFPFPDASHQLCAVTRGGLYRASDDLPIKSEFRCPRWLTSGSPCNIYLARSVYLYIDKKIDLFFLPVMNYICNYAFRCSSRSLGRRSRLKGEG